MKADIDAKIAAYRELDPKRFAIVKEISLRQGFSPSGTMQQRCSIVLARTEHDEGPMLYLELVNVRELKLVQPCWSLVQLTNIEITTVEIGDCRFEISDSEEGVISCCCEDFVAGIA